MDDANASMGLIMTDEEGYVWVRRNADGKIVSASSSKQPGKGWESVSPDDPELLEYLDAVNKRMQDLDKRFPGLAEKRTAYSEFMAKKRDPDKPLN